MELYKTLIPKNNEQDRKPAIFMDAKEGHPTNSGHDQERDMAFIYDSWNENYAKQALDQIEGIQEIYFSMHSKTKKHYKFKTSN